MQSLSEIRTALREETLTLPVLAERYLQQIEATRHLNCYVEVYEQEVRVRAAELQEKFQRDPATVGKLFGMVVSVKDVLSQRDHRLSAGSRMLEGFDPPEADMMGPAVGAVDHDVGFPGQLIVQTAIDQPTDDRRLRGAALDHIIGDAALLTAFGEGAVHRLDDVAAHPEIAQILLRFEADHPFAGSGRCGEAHLLQMLEPADHEAARLGIGSARRFGAQIEIAGVVRGDAYLDIEAGPAFRGDLALERVPDFLFGLRAELDGDEILGPGPQAAADVVAGDDEVRARVVDAPHQ